MRAAESTQARKSGFHMGRRTEPTSASASTTAAAKARRRDGRGERTRPKVRAPSAARKAVAGPGPV